MCEKNLSLLHPFDAEAAKRGKLICSNITGEIRIYVAGPDKMGNLVLNDCDGVLYIGHKSAYSMAPLAWVEGKPVYKGDQLFLKDSGNLAEAVRINPFASDFHQLLLRSGPEGLHFYWDIRDLTWTKPTPTNPYADFKIDEPVMVRNSVGIWQRRYFAGVDNDGLPLAWSSGGTSWSLQDAQYKCAWPECRRPTLEEMPSRS